MRKSKLLMVAVIAATAMNAQTVTPVVVSSQGGFAAGSAGSISWTIGEPLSETKQSGSHLTTQGFHQADLGIANLLREQGNEAAVLVYPNPVREKLSVNFSDLPANEYLLRLTDGLGRIISDRSFVPSPGAGSIELDVAKLANAAYYIEISGGDFRKTVKIIKTN